MCDAGQHYAWLESMTRGRWPGAETAQKYGPLLEWSIYGLMNLLGMTMRSFRFISAAFQLLAAFIALYVLIKMTKSRWAPWLGIMILLLHNLLHHSKEGHFRGLRGTFPFLALLAFYAFSRKRKWYWTFIAGILAALSLGIGTEFGLAGLAGLTGGIVLDSFSRSSSPFRAIAKQSLLLVGGMAIVIAPFFIIYHAHGSLGSLISNSTEYARAFAGGYGNTPFGPNPRNFHKGFAMKVTAMETARCLAKFIGMGYKRLPEVHAELPTIRRTSDAASRETL